MLTDADRQAHLDEQCWDDCPVCWPLARHEEGSCPDDCPLCLELSCEDSGTDAAYESYRDSLIMEV